MAAVKLRTMEFLAFDEYCCFDTSAFFMREPRFIRIKKADVSKRQYSSKAKSSNVRDFAAAKNTVHIVKEVFKKSKF